MFFDTHAHLNFTAFDKDRDKVIKRSLENKIYLLNVGTNYKTSKKAVEIAKRHKKGVYAAVGLHPLHLETGMVKIKDDFEESSSPEIKIRVQGEEFDEEKYEKLAQSSKVVALGETGFDFYYQPKTKIRLQEFKERQKIVFLKHLDLARKLGLPLILHCRKAHKELLEILKLKIKKEKLKIEGVIHCFSGGWQEAREYLEMGFSLGFNGIIFKLNLDEVIKKTPLKKILIETDCPYLVPPMASSGDLNFRNEPTYLKYIAEKIAKIKGISVEELAKITTQNTSLLFKIKI